MKSIVYTYTLLFLTFLTTTLNAQTLVNRAWQDTTGNPKDTLNVLLGAKDGAGNYITVGNTYETNDSEFLLLTKYSNTGTKIWQNHITTPGAARLIATDLNVSGSSFYIAATDYDSALNISSMFTFKCNESTGAVIWSVQYSAFFGYTVPSAVREDNTHSVYVTGIEQVSSTDYRMMVVKYDSTGTQKWVNHYDTSGFYNGAVGMVVNTSTSKVTVAGYSGTTFGSWAIVTANFNTSTGALGTVSRVANPSGSFMSHPVAITRDINDNLFVLGAAEVSGPNVDFKLIKYDSLFNQLWVKTWGGADSLDDEPAYMVADSSGNILITGYTTHSNGHIDLTVIKYSNSGTLLWSNTINNNNASAIHIAEGSSLAVDNSGNAYVTGKIFNGSNYDIVTAEYNANGNILWEKTYDAGGTSNDIGMNVSLDNLNNAYVGGTITTGTTTKYITLSYQPLKINNQAITDTSGNPLYAKGNLIMRFNPSVLSLSFVNDDGKIYGTPKQVLTSSFDSVFETKLTNAGLNTKTCYLEKLAPNYHTTDTCLISKIGDTVHIPPFWSSFLLIFTANNNERLVRDSLKKLYPKILYDHLNYVGQATCNCTSTCADDLYYTSQYGLFNDSTGTYAHGGINAEGAWSLETGKSFVKVGVFDTGIEWGHEDFRTDSIHGTSKVVAGMNYQRSVGVPLYSDSSGGDFSGHGTECAGIIGALRNNDSIGIAGIAGGTWCNNPTPDKSGVALYSFGVTDYYGSLLEPYSSAIVAAMNDALSNNDGISYSNMDIFNFSDAINVNNPDSFQEFKEKFYYAFLLGKIVIASRGNSGINAHTTAVVYPACFNDDWLVCVGGSDYNGGLASSGSLWGYPIDVVAPYFGIMNQTTTITNTYDAFSGTSASAPYITGLAGLLLSHLNNPTGAPDPNNLAPEDVEQIIQRTAYFNSNYTSAPYSDSIGWGRVDMGAAMKMADTTHAHLRHFNSTTTSTTPTVTRVLSGNVGLTLSDPIYSNNSDTILYPAKGYKAEIWKLSDVVHHNVSLKQGTSIIAAWPRSSSSNSFALADSLSNGYTLEPYQKSYMDSTIVPDSSNATIWGYYYLLKDSLNPTDTLGWIPQNPNLTTNRPKLSYTLYIDTFHYIILEVPELQMKTSFAFTAYPNPAADNLHLNLSADKEDNYTIGIFNAAGQQVRTLYEGKTSGLSNDYNISNLESGLYFIEVASAEGKKVIKLSIIK